MDESNLPLLVKLSRTSLTIVDPLGDVRGRLVCTADVERFGIVADLIIDRRAKTVRLLVAQADELDGIRQHLVLIPAEAVGRIDEDHVFVDCTHRVITSAPTYNPHLVLVDLYLREVFEHFGFQWSEPPRNQSPP